MISAPLIVPLAREHAPAAARLHIEGQPGTFLTSLGPDVLTVLYEQLPRSDRGFGFAAVDPVDNGAINLLGFVSATSSVGRLFVELGTTRIGHFLPPLMRRYLQRPQLLLRTVQTAAYPFLVSSGTFAPNAPTMNQDVPTAELLSIMVAGGLRGRGIGTALLHALIGECTTRQVSLLDVTVDSANSGARRFYNAHGFEFARDFELYGRIMSLYQRRLVPVHHV